MRRDNRQKHLRTYAWVALCTTFGCAGEVMPEDEPIDEGTEQSQQGSPEPEPEPDPEPEACGTLGEVRACVTSAGTEGAQVCQWTDSDPSYSECGDTTACQPGTSLDCGLEFPKVYRSCVFSDGAWIWDPYGCNTPLVLSFDNSPVEFTRASGFFDLVGGEVSLEHDWVSPATPWLVLDRNGNGLIDDGAELFGSMTRLADGSRAQHGFEALAELDANHDGLVSEADPLFARLSLWRDRNQDRVATPDEVEQLSSSDVSSLSLDYTLERRCTLTACEVEKARFSFVDGHGRTTAGSVIDVHFRTY